MDNSKSKELEPPATGKQPKQKLSPDEREFLVKLLKILMSEVPSGPVSTTEAPQGSGLNIPVDLDPKAEVPLDFDPTVEVSEDFHPTVEVPGDLDPKTEIPEGLTSSAGLGHSPISPKKVDKKDPAVDAGEEKLSVAANELSPIEKQIRQCFKTALAASDVDKLVLSLQKILNPDFEEVMKEDPSEFMDSKSVEPLNSSDEDDLPPLLMTNSEEEEEDREVGPGPAYCGDISPESTGTEGDEMKTDSKSGTRSDSCTGSCGSEGQVSQEKKTCLVKLATCTIIIMFFNLK